MNKSVWIDIDNAPHVQIFRPIIAELNRSGYTILVTARDHAFSCELLDQANIPYTKIGKHYGKNTLMKVLGTLFRSVQLLLFTFRHHIDLALNHGSRSMILTCYASRIPCVAMFDYEHSNKTVLKLATAVLVPEIISSFIKQRGFPETKVLSYSGLKEDIYCHDGFHETDLRLKFGISTDNIVVTIRPPATTAHYHNAESEKILTELLFWLSKQKQKIRVLISPRTPMQAKELQTMNLDTGIFTILHEPVDGRGLLLCSDVVISGGGTMNREAAVLAVPAYSIFQGELGLIDAWLAKEKKLTLIRTSEEVRHIVLAKKRQSQMEQQRSTLNIVVDRIIKFIQ